MVCFKLLFVFEKKPTPFLTSPNFPLWKRLSRGSCVCDDVFPITCVYEMKAIFKRMSTKSDVVKICVCLAAFCVVFLRLCVPSFWFSFLFCFWSSVLGVCFSACSFWQGSSTTLGRERIVLSNRYNLNFAAFKRRKCCGTNKNNFLIL